MFKYVTDAQVPRAVKWWLVTGLVMIFLQIFIGGVTRLTGSGLSITKWEIVTGALPPLNEPEWQVQFELYQQTPQYQKINQGMSLDAFKFIFFWEYFHRLWARLMFFVFVVPFGWFLWRGMLSRRLLPKLLTVVGLAGLEGFFGWIMVASGLRERPWVNAYNLTLHLTMGMVIFSYLLWTIFVAYRPEPSAPANQPMRRFARGLLFLSYIQIALGAMMSGTKAGLVYPTWPSMHGTYFPDILFDASMWSTGSMIHYDSNPFMATLIQFLHRNTAYVLTALVIYFVWKISQKQITSALRLGNRLLLAALALQIVLGIVTLISCNGKIPVDLGVAHQSGAVVLLSAVLFVNYQFSKKHTVNALSN